MSMETEIQGGQGSAQQGSTRRHDVGHESQGKDGQTERDEPEDPALRREREQPGESAAHPTEQSLKPDPWEGTEVTP